MQDDTQAVLRARQEFFSAGRVRQGAVAEAIERSWRRCLDNGLDTSSPIVNELITQDELAHKCEQNELLLSHARPEMATLNEQISHTRSMVILTDDEGLILHSLGDDNFLSAAQRIALSPGCSWHEEQRGTNAIGTALADKAPMTVQGAEHYMERHHILSCSAVPIFGAANELVGTLDVSNDYLMPQQHTLALVKMAAQMIENRLFRASCKGEFALHFHARPEFIGTLWEGIAVFSGDGTLVALNRSGQFQLELAGPARGIHFDSLFDMPLNATLARGASAEQLIFPLRLANGARLFARLEISPERSSAASRAEFAATRPKRTSAANFDMLDSGDPRVARAIAQVRMVLQQDIPILIEGETGVGKELFARAIHDASSRSHGPWVAVNCASLPEGLIESELFGYEEGAFTGARRRGSTGKLEQAHGGTLFLDEIGDMPLALQARLLRVLQERSVTPLGGSKAKTLDFSLVSATNQKLREKVESGEFRSDLYYRLNGLSVTLPPLRQRTDLSALLDMLLQIEHAEHAEFTPEVMELFHMHPWPGNIRQLHNVVRTALALASGKPITEMHLTQDFLDDLERLVAAEPEGATLDDLAGEAIRTALRSHEGNVSAAARQLGISRNTMYRRMKALGLV
ncbi:MAG TPA: sigma-54-dependent Fis family transcriptional regulator [Methylophilaceae bacterium]|jgi:transcriptional regulator of acetoin/glycerol metabolism|nr:sigma-54-dependent Fis family transcriptional regulator [Methylophilaceae bacterium]